MYCKIVCYRWTELMELIIKALPRPQLTSRLVPTNRESHPTMSSELHVNAVQQKAVSQQAEELFKMVSEQTKANKPLQKLCNALYTCDPHRTGKDLINTNGYLEQSKRKNT